MVDTERAREALSYVPPDDRDLWLRMGMAVKAALGELGFDVWDSWSQQSESYDPTDIRDVWKSIGSGSGKQITAGTLFFEAKARGWQDSGTRHKPTEAEIAERKRQAQKRQAKERAEIQREQDQAAYKGAAVWNAAEPATAEDPYLSRKDEAPTETLRRIDAAKAAQIIGYVPKSSGSALSGVLTVAPVKRNGRLSTVELIDGTGRKTALAGRGTKSGGYWATGDLRDDGTLVIGEGVATVLSASRAIGCPGVAALSSGNLVSVSKVIQERYPNAALVILADLGKKTGEPDPHAVEASQTVGGLLAIPDFGTDRAEEQTDFNDLAAHRGAEAVRASIRAARAPDDGDDWPTLIPLGTQRLPSMDLDGLPAWAGDYARALAADTETPPELAAGMVLVACAAAAARRLRIMVRAGYFEPCNLWTVCALPPGNRKSAVQAAATAPLIDWERDQATALEAEIKRVSSERKTMEARAKEIRSKAAKEKNHAKAVELAREAADIEARLPEVPVPPQLWTSDATSERLGVLLADHGECMAWLSSEGGIFDLLQGRYSNGIPNLDLVLKAHSGDSERVDRASRPPVFLRGPLLSIGLSPQPDVLRGLSAKPGFRGRGLLGRFLYLLPPSPLGFRSLEPNPIPEGVRIAYAAGLRAMLDWESATDDDGNDKQHLLRLSQEAYAEWFEFAQAIEAQMQPGRAMDQFTDWAGKAAGAAARLAGVLHGIKHAHGRPWEIPVGVETMTAALEIMAVITRHSIAALDMMGADQSIAGARKVWEWIERGRRNGFTVRDAFEGLKGTFQKVRDLLEALDILAERGYLEIMEPTREGPGRPPSPVVRIRPEIVKGWR